MISSQNYRPDGAFMFQFRQVAVFPLLEFQLIRFLSQIIFFCRPLPAYSICNLFLLIPIDAHECMLSRVPFFFANCCTGLKKFFNIFHLSVTRKHNPCKWNLFQKYLAKLLLCLWEFVLLTVWLSHGKFSHGFLPGPNPASFPNPMQITLRLGAKRKAFDQNLKKNQDHYVIFVCTCGLSSNWFDFLPVKIYAHTWSLLQAIILASVWILLVIFPVIVPLRVWSSHAFKSRCVLKLSLNVVFNLQNTFDGFCQTAFICKIKQKNPLRDWSEF